MKFVKVILIILASLSVAFGAFWQFYLKEQVAFAKVATAYGAKMVCSCRFVAEREMESCRGDFTEDVSQIDFDVSDHTAQKDGNILSSRKSVTASAPFGLSRDTAVFEPGLGCTLVKP